MELTPHSFLPIFFSGLGILALGCGANTPTGDFAIVAEPSALTIADDGTPQTLTVGVTAKATFSGTVTISASGLPPGVSTSPSTLSLSPGQVGEWTMTASNASAGTYPLTLTGSSGTAENQAVTTLLITPAAANAALSSDNFDFGGEIVGSSVIQTVATVTNTGAGVLSLSPSLSGDPAYALVASGSCGSSLSAGASCSQIVSYTPVTASSNSPQTAVLNFNFGNVPQGTAQTVSLSGTSAPLLPGTVTSTSNPQVAQYQLTLPFPGSVVVNFGLDTTYGRQTWARSTTSNNGTVNMLVAGMLASTTYHMRASYTLANGTTVQDIDQSFTTGVAEVQPNLQVTTTPGLTPQSGLEQLTFVGGPRGVAVTDLSGNVLWSYAPPSDADGDLVQGAKLLPNGNFLVSIGPSSSAALNDTGSSEEAIIAIREIDLAGDIIREITAQDLSYELAAAGYNLSLQEFHHDVTPLPNGHWLILSNVIQSFTDLPGYPGVTNVLGDVIIDVDQNLEPVWVWNTFDYLDINRHPWNFPDWTHTNAIVYSPSDGNIFVSMRDQNWVLKVDYANGSGAGDILWHLGEGSDFTLIGGVDPTDWQYAQHFPSVFSTNSSGLFSLGVMDNGDDRIFPAGVTCGASGAPPCLYSTIPVFQLDEGARTATLIFHQILDPSLYNNFGGSVDLLGNGDIEYDLCGVGSNSEIFEVTDTSTPQAVWHMHSQDGNVYRGYRIPSLYPGVQW